MNFLGRGSRSAESDAATDDAPGDVVTVGEGSRAQNTGKGRPTPSRRQAQGKRRGPVAPPPKTQREAFKRSKEQRGTKEERRQRADDRRSRMMAGDDRVLPVRDRGPIRAHVRDLVDSGRHLMGLFMPVAVLIFITVVVPVPGIQRLGSLVCVLVLAAMVIEGLLLARMVIGRVRARFPDEEIKPFSIGWYAATRATQVRKLRMPAPRVERGAAV